MAELFNITMPSDLTEWTTVTAGSGQSATWQADAGHNDGPGLRLDVANTNGCYTEKTFTALDPATHSAFGLAFNLRDLEAWAPDKSDGAVAYLGRIFAGTTDRCYFEIKNTSGTRQLRFRYTDDGATIRSTGQFTVSAETWVYIRLTRSSDDSTADGFAEVFFNGVSQGTATSAILYDNFDLSKLRLGHTSFLADVTGTLRFGPVIARNDGTEITEPVTNTAPEVSVPTSDYVAFTDVTLALTGLVSVADADNDLATIRVQCSAGAGVDVTNLSSCTVSAGTRGTTDFTLAGTQANLNAAIGTLTILCTTAGAKTITITGDDTVDTDVATFDVNAGPSTITITGGTIAQINATLATLLVRLDESETSGTVVVLTTDNAALTDEDTLVLVTDPDITIETHPMAQAVVEPQTATFSLEQTGGTTYQWYRAEPLSEDFMAISGATSDEYTTEATTQNGDDGARYYCVVSNELGAETSNTAELVVTKFPVFVLHPASQTVTVPSPATFSVDVVGYTSGQWYRDAVAISGETGLSYTLATTNYAQDNGAEFSFVATNGVWSLASNVAVLSLTELDVAGPMFVAAARVRWVPGNSRKLAVSGGAVPVERVWKFPKDLYDVAVNWEGPQILPSGAAALGALAVVVKDDGGTDVTSSLLVDSGVEGLIAWAEIQGGTIGEVYDVIFNQTFDTGEVLEKYVQIEIRNPRNYVTPEVFKYPNDAFPVTVQWDGRMPRGVPAVTLDSVVSKAYTAIDGDESSTYIDSSYVAKKISASNVKAGSGGDSRMLEIAATFSNGRKFHEYATLTVRVPPA